MSEIVSNYPIKPWINSSETAKFFGTLIRNDTEESFCLSQRTFDTVDSFFIGKISALIDFFWDKNEGQVVNVIDVAAGFDGLCAKQLAQRYQEKVNVMGIDLAESSSGSISNYRHVRDDFLNISKYVEDHSIDLIYSYKFFQFLEPSFGGPFLTFPRRKPFIEMMIKILKPEGVALIQDHCNSLVGLPINDFCKQEDVEIVAFGKTDLGRYRVNRIPCNLAIAELIPPLDLDHNFAVEKIFS